MSILVGYKRLLTIANVILLSGIIASYHYGCLQGCPVSFFLIVCVLVFGLSFYRPVMVFAIFVGFLPLEIINIAPDIFGASLRPYQMLGIATLGGMIFSMMFRIDQRRFFQWNIFDTGIIAFLILSVAGALLNIGTDVVVQQTVIVISFGVLYFIVRLFVHDRKEIIALLPIIISSGVIVSLYAIGQNLLFRFSMTHLEVMPGRPNATFTEPDWLGMYLVFVLAICVAYLYYNAYHKHLWRFFDIALYCATAVIFIALIITVARSAWLGALVVFLLYYIVLIVQKKYKLFARHFAWSISIAIVSTGIVFGLHLTSFELDNRLQSTGSGLQEITVSCPSEQSRDHLLAEEDIVHIDRLDWFGCRHIDLEEIEAEELLGSSVFKIYRKDPNVAVRSQVYIESLAIIQKQPLTGYGWGASGTLLGDDDSGTPLNASNIFLETAISIGVIGAGILIAIFILIFMCSLHILFTAKNTMDKSIALVAFLGGAAILIPNLFNAGLLLGFVWVFFGMLAILRKIC